MLPAMVGATIFIRQKLKVMVPPPPLIDSKMLLSRILTFSPVEKQDTPFLFIRSLYSYHGIHITETWERYSC